jgi:ADP-ribose pyrophosphatase
MKENHPRPPRSENSRKKQDILERVGRPPFSCTMVLSSSYLRITLDPGFTNTNMNVVFCDVDVDDERNKNPKPEVDEGEVIETFKVPLANLHDELKKLEEKGFALDARLASFALGLMAAKWYNI